MNLLRLLRLPIALPGRLLINHLDRERSRNGIARLSALSRGTVHGFVWLFAVAAFSMATISMPTATAVPASAPTAVPVVRTAPRYVPPPPTTTSAAPTPAPVSTAPSTAVDEPAEPVYVPLPDDDEDDGESWFCRRRRWC
jgi:hypothetical protein